MTMWRIAILGTIGALALSPAALASHGKVGTWEATIKSAGTSALPDMAKLSPAAQAQMKVHGMRMNAGGGVTTKFCMTAEQVNNDKPPLSHRGSCDTRNITIKGDRFTADIVCKGKVNAKGYFEVTFDSPERYRGRTTMTMTINGKPTTHETSVEARWLSPACTVKPN